LRVNHYSMFHTFICIIAPNLHKQNNFNNNKKTCSTDISNWRCVWCLIHVSVW
jgi:hypothetical protein